MPPFPADRPRTPTSERCQLCIVRINLLAYQFRIPKNFSSTPQCVKIFEHDQPTRVTIWFLISTSVRLPMRLLHVARNMILIFHSKYRTIAVYRPNSRVHIFQINCAIWKNVKEYSMFRITSDTRLGI